MIRGAASGPAFTAGVALCVAAFAIPSPARAAPFADVTSTTTAGVHTDRDYGEVFERLNASSSRGAWHMGLRLDSATPLYAPAPEIAHRYTVEKVTLAWTSRSLELSAGDAYVSFGRGLALSLRKIDELGLDTTLRGAKLLVHRGDFELTTVAGATNINNLDEATGTTADDPYDLIGGVQATTALGAVRVGAYGTTVAFRHGLGAVAGPAYADRAFQLGVTADAPRLAGGLGAYVEAMLQTVSSSPMTAPTGWAIYASAPWSHGRASLLFEGKLYGALTALDPHLAQPAFANVVYNSPPTVERVLQLLEDPQRDVGGGRLRFDWRFAPSFLAYVNYGAFWDWQGYGDPRMVGVVRPAAIHDPYAGVEARWNQARSWAIAAGGYRAVVLDGDGPLVRGDGHLDVDVTQALAGPWSVTAHALYLERRKDASPILDERFREANVEAGIRVRPWGAASLGWDFTNDPTQPKRNYLHGTLAWNLGPSSSVQLFVGSGRGGLRCISGVCRVFPPFEGVKLTVTLRF